MDQCCAHVRQLSFCSKYCIFNLIFLQGVIIRMRISESVFSRIYISKTLLRNLSRKSWHTIRLSRLNSKWLTCLWPRVFSQWSNHLNFGVSSFASLNARTRETWMRLNHCYRKDRMTTSNCVAEIGNKEPWKSFEILFFLHRKLWLHLASVIISRIRLIW